MGTRRHLSVVGDGDKPPPPEKACLVRSDGEWWRGTLTWESSKRADGLWWATVTYRKGEQVVTEARSQHDLRAQ